MLGVATVDRLHEAPADAQRLMSQELDSVAARRLPAHCPEADRVRLLSEAGFGASSWLRAITSKWELQIPNVDYRVCLQWSTY